MSSYIKPIESKFLKITTPEMIEVDRLMKEHFQIELIQMMENAGRCLAILAREVFLKNDAYGKKIIVLAGSGGNGGGALVCARRLHTWGANVKVILSAGEERMTAVAKHQFTILKQMGILFALGNNIVVDYQCDLLIDGILGYNVKGDPYGVPKQMINWANQREEKILSLDTPSGLDLTSGFVHLPSIVANATLTLAMPKKGLFEEEARKVVGSLYLGDISVPTELYRKDSLNLEAPNMFRYSDIVRIY